MGDGGEEVSSPFLPRRHSLFSTVLIPLYLFPSACLSVLYLPPLLITHQALVIILTNLTI